MILRVGPPYLKIVLMMAFTTVALLIHEPWSSLKDTLCHFLKWSSTRLPLPVSCVTQFTKDKIKIAFSDDHNR